MSYIIQALEQLDDISIGSSKSAYYNSKGERVPRVTEILSTMIHSDNLMYWANSLGFKGLRYKDVLSNAADVGTEAHAAIECFLKDKIKTESNIPFLGFLSWYNTITMDIGLPIEVISVECKLACDWFGGTLDALLRIGDKLYLVDFKTSNHVTFKYFLQLSAYKYMLKVVNDINIDGVIVLQVDKTEPGFNEYLLDFSIQDHYNFINHCESTFLSLVYAYFNICKAEIYFKNIF